MSHKGIKDINFWSCCKIFTSFGGKLGPKFPMSLWWVKRASLEESRVEWQKEHWTWSPKLSVWVPEPPLSNQLNTLGKTLFFLDLSLLTPKLLDCTQSLMPLKF